MQWFITAFKARYFLKWFMLLPGEAASIHAELLGFCFTGNASADELWKKFFLSLNSLCDIKWENLVYWN